MKYKDFLSLFEISEEDLKSFKKLKKFFSEEFKNTLSEKTKIFIIKYLPKSSQILMNGRFEKAFEGTIGKFLDTFLEKPEIVEDYVETIAKTHVNIKVPPKDFFLDYLKFYEELFFYDKIPEEEKQIFKKFLFTILITGIYIFYYTIKDIKSKELRDPVTGLLPSKTLIMEIPELLKKYSTLAIIDIDRFWEINFYYGYLTGNSLLALIASVLQNRFLDSTIFRWQNDEFVIFTNENPKNVQEKLLHLRQEFLLNPIFLPTREGTVETKISFSGIISPTELFREKDLRVLQWELHRLLEEVKNSQENALKLISDIDLKNLEEEKFIIDKVLEALYLKKVKIAFQGVVDIFTGETVYNEILARIETDGQIITAGKFINLIEGTSVEAELDKIVIEKTLSPVSKVMKLGKVSINLPFPFLRNQYPWISRKLKLINQKNKFIFELSEREDIFKIQQIVHKIKGLSTLGAEISLDDFGTKFSNFLLVKKLPINHIKIDGNFVKDSIKNELDKTFLESIIKVAKLKGANVTAEFVDSLEIVDILKELGESLNFKNIYGQGYLWHKPEILE